MDTKRSQSLRKVPTPVASKAKMAKTQSQASVTPSQISEQNKTASADKNPLDALSRNAMQPTIERRSGLQDIDEEFMRRLNFSTQSAPRYEHAAGKRTPSSAEMGLNETRMQAGGVAQQQPAQQMNIAQDQGLPMQPMQMVQQPNTVAPNANTMQQPQQQQQQQQQQIPQQQVNYSPAAGEPEMCTTCPNCQTIIYLTRINEEPPMNNSMHGQPDGTAVGAGMS